MSTNAFSSAIPTANVAVTAAAQTISPTYAAAGQALTSYRLVNQGTQTIFFLFGAAPVVTVANGIPMLPGTETFSGPPNSTVQVIAAATGSTLYVSAGEGL